MTYERRRVSAPRSFAEEMHKHRGPWPLQRELSKSIEGDTDRRAAKPTRFASGP